jgi:hypothetical protein
MKTIKWEKGIHGIIGNYPSKNGKMLIPNDPVELGMHVTAKYKGLDVSLRVQEEIRRGTFKATVMFFEPVLAKKPDDLLQGDEVLIELSDICCIFAKK